MNRRVSRPAVALFALVLCLSAPTAFAAQRADGPDFGTRIVRILKTFARHFGFQSQVDWPSIPKP